MEFGKHAFYIWGSYGIVAIVLVGLVWWLISDGRRHAAQLNRLDLQRSSDQKVQD